MDLEIVAGVAVAFAAIIGLIFSFRQVRSFEKMLGVDVLLRLEQVFEDKMREKRRTSAEALRRGSGATGFPPEVVDVFRFFNTLGLVSDRRAIDDKLVQAEFSEWALGYWEAGNKSGFLDTRGYVEDANGKKRCRWPEFEALVDRLESKSGQRRTEIDEFFDHECHA